MTYEVIVEEFVLHVEVTDYQNSLAHPNCWTSDWDFYGSRELEFSVVSGFIFDAKGKRVTASESALLEAGEHYAREIETELWRQIDSNTQRQRWMA